MNLVINPFGILACVFVMLLSSCANRNKYTVGPDGSLVDKDGNHYNPHEPGTYDHFKGEKDYPKTRKVWKNESVLARTNSGNSSILVSLDIQRAFLMNGDEVAVDYPISSGKKSRPTPPGDYKILEKEVDKASNAYGKVYDAEGNRIYGEETPDAVPEGGKFVGAPMPYWMRLTWDGVGHHIGTIPKGRYAASHACIRGIREAIPTVYGKVKIGTPVTVE
ncbi:L,D-transpeptidase family protein [Haloferula sp.]|uniref:L,D-transpeptidase family protein n=1 Tax=Haloferula sp. TaxID=2497595 RepID=UPI00329FFA26